MKKNKKLFMESVWAVDIECWDELILVLNQIIIANDKYMTFIELGQVTLHSLAIWNLVNHT